MRRPMIDYSRHAVILDPCESVTLRIWHEFSYLALPGQIASCVPIGRLVPNFARDYFPVGANSKLIGGQKFDARGNRLANNLH